MAGTPAEGLAALTEAQRAQAMTRWRMLRPHIEGQVSLPAAAAASGVPLCTLERWLARYRAEGLAGLARAERADRGRRRLPAELVALIEGLALRRPPPSTATVHRQAAAVAAEQGWPVPSYATVYDIVCRLDPGLLTLAREGSKRYREVFDLIRRRDADRPNEIWQADHTQLDLWVVAPSGQPTRRFLQVRCIVADEVTVDPLSQLAAWKSALAPGAGPGGHFPGPGQPPGRRAPTLAPAAGHATSVRPVSQPDTVNTGARTAMTASPTAGGIGRPIVVMWAATCPGADGDEFRALVVLVTLPWASNAPSHTRDRGGASLCAYSHASSAALGV